MTYLPHTQHVYNIIKNNRCSCEGKGPHQIKYKFGIISQSVGQMHRHFINQKIFKKISDNLDGFISFNLRIRRRAEAHFPTRQFTLCNQPADTVISTFDVQLDLRTATRGGGRGGENMRYHLSDQSPLNSSRNVDKRSSSAMPLTSAWKHSSPKRIDA